MMASQLNLNTLAHACVGLCSLGISGIMNALFAGITEKRTKLISRERHCDKKGVGKADLE